MKAFTKCMLVAASTSLLLFGCSPEEETVDPLKTTTSSEIIGYDPTTCNLVENFGPETAPRLVTMIEEDGARILVQGQQRISKGVYSEDNMAMVLDPYNPGAANLDYETDPFLAIGGMLTVNNGDGTGANVHQKGGRLTLDFSPVSSVTMKGFFVFDIEESEKGSKVELYSSTGQLLEQKELPVTGKGGAEVVSFANVPGVAKMVVTFGAENTQAGSGAIGRLQVCVEGQGACIPCNEGAPVNSLWLQYTGSKEARVKVSAGKNGKGKYLYRNMRMKPGTVFKVASAQGNLGRAIYVSAGKEVQTIATDCSSPLKETYGQFKVLEARGDERYCLQE